MYRVRPSRSGQHRSDQGGKQPVTADVHRFGIFFVVRSDTAMSEYSFSSAGTLMEPLRGKHWTFKTKASETERILDVWRNRQSRVGSVCTVLCLPDVLLCCFASWASGFTAELSIDWMKQCWPVNRLSRAALLLLRLIILNTIVSLPCCHSMCHKVLLHESVQS